MYYCRLSTAASFNVGKKKNGLLFCGLTKMDKNNDSVVQVHGNYT